MRVDASYILKSFGRVNGYSWRPQKCYMETIPSTWVSLLPHSTFLYIAQESSPVVCEDNTNILITGPIGHKPTYSASFTTSIGTHNAVKLRTLVAHCTHVSSLTERYLRNWISSFGLDIDRLKVLAISFSPSITGESVPSTVMSSMGMNHHHNQQPQLQTQTAFAPFIQALQATQTHQPIRQQTSAMTTYLGVPGGGFSMLANVTIHPSGAPPPPATTVVGSSPITTPSTEREEAEKIQLNFALMESRMQSWLIRTPRKQVDQWVQIKNTDLRAGERWLLYVCPTLQAMRNLRF
jgi:hypothetical protein